MLRYISQNSLSTLFFKTKILIGICLGPADSFLIRTAIRVHKIRPLNTYSVTYKRMNQLFQPVLYHVLSFFTLIIAVGTSRHAIIYPGGRMRLDMH